MKRKWGRLASILLIVILFFTFVYPIEDIALFYKEKDRILQLGSSKVEAATNPKLASLSEELSQSRQRMDESLEKEAFKNLQKEVKKSSKKIAKSKTEIHKEFSKHRKKAGGHKTALKRLKAFEKDVDKRMDAIEQDYAAISSSLESKKPDIAKVKQQLDNIDEMLASAQEHVPIGKAGDLPNQNIQMEEIAPTTKKDTLPSYLSRNATILNSLETTPQDLTETTETKFTKDIEELADSLDDSPLSIYEHVKNTIQFEPYFGSRKGATGTLQQQSGNAVDQASLLIALLRYKEIPARYVSGTVEIPIDQVTDWIRVKDSEQAVKTIASLGIPVKAIIKEGKIFKVQMEHIWVEAHIPYEDYRGTGKRQGEQVWVPLDPSFKQSTYTEGIDIEKISGLDKEEVLDIIQNSGDISGNLQVKTNVDYDALHDKMEAASNRIEKYIKDKGFENKGVDELLGGWKISQETVDLLPAKLPYKLINEFGEFHELPKTMQESVGFSIRGATAHGFNFSGGNDFTYEATAAELYGKRITLSWQPATKADENIIAEYGGIYQVPAYMVKVRPVLKVDGETVEQGKPVGLGYNQEFIMDFHVPGRSVDKVRNPVSAGSFYAVGLDYGKIASSELDQIKENLEAAQPTLTEETLYTDEGMGEILNGVIKSYYGQLRMANELAATQNDVSVHSLLNAGMTGYRTNVSYSFMSPAALSPGGMYIDIDRNISSVVSKTGDRNAERTYMLTSGTFSSAMEHEIFEQMFEIPSVSTVKILEEANNRGIPIHTISKENVDVVLPEIETSDTVRKDIRESVQQGRVVTIPEEEIQYFDWVGSGYLVMDPETGAAGYMISGGLAGGAMSVAVTGAIILAGIDTMVMIASAVSLMLAGPAGVLLGIGMAILAVHFVGQFIGLMYEYFVLGHHEAGREMVLGAVLGLIGGFASKALVKAVPGLHKQFTNLYNNVKRLLIDKQVMNRLTKEYSGEFVDNVMRKSGITDFDSVDRLTRELTDSGISKSLIKKTGIADGHDGLKHLQKLTAKGIDEKQILDVLDKGIKLKNVSKLADLNVLPKDFGKYGIGNNVEARVVNKLLKRDFTNEHLISIVSKNVRLSEISRLGVRSGEQVPKFLKALDGGKYAKIHIGPPFEKMIDEVLKRHNVSVQEFNILRTKDIKDLTSSDITLIKQIRESIPMPVHGQGMQKAIPNNAIEAYMKGEQDWAQKIGGFVTRVEDTSHLKNPKEIFEALRLDYENTRFRSRDYSYGLLRYPLKQGNQIKISYGGNTLEEARRMQPGAETGNLFIAKAPYAGNGFTKSSDRIIPEYQYIDGKGIPIENGTELYEVTHSGLEVLRAVYDEGIRKFISAY